ncbi:hypothetical protein Q4511_15170 [Paracoccus sp. 1_MG-2023]|nr:hypothetical protein [Paracoccus sp. C2R09]MDO6670265.1 hypothetical protein [Paracoccus sp. 1_MG-2023]
MRDGLAPDGRRLVDAMPRYEITDDAIDGLVRFLQGIDADQRRGVGPRSIHISARAGGDALRGLSLAVDRFNRDGGAFGRSLTMGPRETSLLDEEDLGRILDLRLERAGIKPVLRAELYPSPARADTHPRTLRAYFHGLVLGQALIECGRDVTRHCIEDHARKLRLSMFLDLP